MDYEALTYPFNYGDKPFFQQKLDNETREIIFSPI